MNIRSLIQVVFLFAWCVPGFSSEAPDGPSVGSITSSAHIQLFAAIHGDQAIQLSFAIFRKVRPDFVADSADYLTGIRRLSFAGNGSSSRRLYQSLSTLKVMGDDPRLTWPTEVASGVDSTFVPRIFQRLSLMDRQSISFSANLAGGSLTSAYLGPAKPAKPFMDRVGMPVDPFHAIAQMHALLDGQVAVSHLTVSLPFPLTDLLDISCPLRIPIDSRDVIHRQESGDTMVETRDGSLLVARMQLAKSTISFADGSTLAVSGLPVRIESRMYREVLQGITVVSASRLQEEFERAMDSATRVYDELTGSIFDNHRQDSVPGGAEGGFR